MSGLSLHDPMFGEPLIVTLTFVMSGEMYFLESRLPAAQGSNNSCVHTAHFVCERLAADHFVHELDVGQLGVVRASDHAESLDVPGQQMVV